jgi:spore photoproduct lyase
MKGDPVTMMTIFAAVLIALRHCGSLRNWPGCFYQCDWCYLKLTYRAAFPFITVRAQYEKIKDLLTKRLVRSDSSVILIAGSWRIPWLWNIKLEPVKNSFPGVAGLIMAISFFMLTESDNVDDILDLPHNGHTIIAWSLNQEAVSRKFEIGAPTFARRLEAAHKAQQAGHRLRLRLDPIVPFTGWQAAYAETIKRMAY